MSTCTTESEQPAAPLDGEWVRSGFFKVFDASQGFKMKVIAAVQSFLVLKRLMSVSEILCFYLR